SPARIVSSSMPFGIALGARGVAPAVAAAVSVIVAVLDAAMAAPARLACLRNFLRSDFMLPPGSVERVARRAGNSTPGGLQFSRLGAVLLKAASSARS